MNLKRLAEISPVVGAFLIFIGYLKLHLYYNHWGINISSYLDFSEITLSFLNDINTVLFFILMMILQMTIGIGTIASIDNEMKIFKSKIQSINAIPKSEEFPGLLPTIDKAFDENRRLVVSVLTIMMLIMIFLYIYYLKLTFLYLLFIISIQYVALFLDEILGVKDKRTIVQTSFVVIFLGFTFCLAQYDIKQTEISNSQIILQTNLNEHIKTDKNFIFIGKTNNYYFFFDKAKNQATILQEESIIKSTTTN